MSQTSAPDEQVFTGERFQIRFVHAAYADVAELLEDELAVQLAQTNPDFLARLVSLHGVPELEDAQQFRVKRAALTLFSALSNAEPATIDQVASWTAPNASPPLRADFKRDEIRWLRDNQHTSLFLRAVAEITPGFEPGRPTTKVHTGDYL